MRQKHKAYDKGTPRLFKVEAEGKAMIALCSKTYILKKHDDKVQFSSKALNKAILKDPFPSYQHVLQWARQHHPPTMDSEPGTIPSTPTNRANMDNYTFTVNEK